PRGLEMAKATPLLGVRLKHTPNVLDQALEIAPAKALPLIGLHIVAGRFLAGSGGLLAGSGALPVGFLDATPALRQPLTQLDYLLVPVWSQWMLTSLRVRRITLGF